MPLVYVLLIILVILMIAGGPYTGWHTYGYYPSGVVGLVLIILLVLLLAGRL